MDNERTFLAIAEHCSLSKAADALNVAKSTVSARLAELETYLGASLVNRNSRKLVLTEIGHAYYKHLKIALALADEAESLVRSMSTGVSGELTVHVPPGLMEHWLSKPIAQFLHQYPDIRLNICTMERPLEGLGKEADIGFHWGELPDSCLYARRVFQDNIIFVAGSQYVKNRKIEPKSPHIEFVQFPKSYGGDTQKRIASSAEVWWVYQMPSRITANSMEALVALLLENTGISMLPKSYVIRHIETGRLVDVTHAMQQEPFSLWCYAVTMTRPRSGSRIHRLLQHITGSL